MQVEPATTKLLQGIQGLFQEGMVSSAYELSLLAAKSVELNVHQIGFYSGHEISQQMGGSIIEVAAVQSRLYGQLQGQGFLILEHQSGMLLTRHLLNEELQHEYLMESEKDVIVDFCASIINGPLMVLSQRLDVHLHTRLPQYFEGELEEILQTITGMSFGLDSQFLQIQILIHIPEAGFQTTLTYVQKAEEVHTLFMPVSRYFIEQEAS